MLILLPPSESKRAGGDAGSRLELTGLRFPSLTRQREECLQAVATLAEDVQASLRALKLSEARSAEVMKNRALASSPVMPAALRYTGVLFDALDAASLPQRGLAVLEHSVVVHTALFGPVGALDHIPDYRLSADSRIPGLPLKRLWASAVAEEFARADGLVIDARSQAYVALGEAAQRASSLYLHVVTEEPGGVKRALNHFNKKAKGEFVRALALNGDPSLDLDGLLEWARAAGFRLELHGVAEQRHLQLIV